MADRAIAGVRHVQALGGRVCELAAISAPVFNAQSQIVGAVTLTMPTPRLNPKDVVPVASAPEALTAAPGGAAPG